ALYQRIQDIRGETLAQPAIAADVKEEHSDITLAFGQFRCVGIGSHQALNGFGDKLGEVVFDAAQLAQLAINSVLEPQRRLDTRQQLTLIHRLGEKVVGSRLDASDAVL